MKIKQLTVAIFAISVSWSSMVFAQAEKQEPEKPEAEKPVCTIGIEPGFWERMSWPKTCGEMQQEMIANPALSVMYQDAPTVKAKDQLDLWLFDWMGVTLPIPIADYQALVVLSDDGISHSFMLQDGFTDQADRQYGMSLSCVKDEPMQDLFADSDAPSVEGAEFTQTVFGKSPTMMDMFELGWNTTPNDLHCSSWCVYDDSKVITTLALKSVLDASFVYRDISASTGFVTGRSNHDATKLEHAIAAYFIPLAHQDYMCDVKYYLPKGYPIELFGGIVSRPSQISPFEQPEWLAAWQGVLDNRSDVQAWQSLQQELIKNENFSDRGQLSIHELVEKMSVAE